MTARVSSEDDATRFVREATEALVPLDICHAVAAADAAGIVDLFSEDGVFTIGKRTARGRCSVEIRMVRGEESITAAGWYDDRYRRVDGRWRFAERTFHVFHMVPLAKGWA